MCWRFIAASTAGTSHVVSSRPCEDAYIIFEQVAPDGSPFLFAAVADGAGSAANAQIGSHIAVEIAAASALSLWRTSNPFPHERSPLSFSMQFAAPLIQPRAEGAEPRDFATTFLAAVCAGGRTTLIQIGDGVIACDFGEGLHIPIRPMCGEYANQTRFITDEDAFSIATASTTNALPIRLALMSDGLQRLAINMSTSTPHEPFFSPFFSALASATDDVIPTLTIALQRFLESPQVNARTDDDKTLVVVTRPDGAGCA